MDSFWPYWALAALIVCTVILLWLFGLRERFKRDKKEDPAHKQWDRH